MLSRRHCKVIVLFYVLTIITRLNHWPWRTVTSSYIACTCAPLWYINERSQRVDAAALATIAKTGVVSFPLSNAISRSHATTFAAESTCVVTMEHRKDATSASLSARHRHDTNSGWWWWLTSSALEIIQQQSHLFVRSTLSRWNGGIWCWKDKEICRHSF